ncbi:MAG: 4Fe-4S binding protein, partial [Termitinemataceae bacterium]
MKMKKQKPILAPLRLTVQLVFLVIVTLMSLNRALAAYGIQIPLVGDASLHGICPFGGVVSLYQLVTVGTLVQKIHEAALVTMSIVLVLSILAGPVFCGWICPFGTVEELIGRLGKKLFKRKYNTFVPQTIDKYLRYLRYVVLVWVLYLTATTMKLIFSDVDPYYALFNFWTGEVPLTALGILAATLIGSLFIERPFCKYLCPYGALLGLFNKIRVFTIRRNPSTCISCSACDRS